MLQSNVFIFQNFGKSFLVAFGPCKHGKYNQTEYQDVFVFDIVDYTDALRHAILTGDRVLAPWEPEGERFAPGIVIDGQENRQADGKLYFFFLFYICLSLQVNYHLFFFLLTTFMIFSGLM